MSAQVLFSQKAVARPHRSVDKHLCLYWWGAGTRRSQEGRKTCLRSRCFQLKREQDVQLREGHSSACCPHPSRAPRSSFPDGSLQSFTETPSQWEPSLRAGLWRRSKGCRAPAGRRWAVLRVPLPGGEGGPSLSEPPCWHWLCWGCELRFYLNSGIGSVGSVGSVDRLLSQPGRASSFLPE